MQESGLWQAVLGEIELSVSRGNFVTWFKNTQLVRNKDDVLVVGVPNIFVKNQLENKFNGLVLEVLAKNGVKPEKIEYKIHTGINPQVKRDDIELVDQVERIIAQRPEPRGARQVSGTAHSYRQGLNGRYTFDNFVVGAGNELAYAACQAIS